MDEILNLVSSDLVVAFNRCLPVFTLMFGMPVFALVFGLFLFKADREDSEGSEGSEGSEDSECMTLRLVLREYFKILKGE